MSEILAGLEDFFNILNRLLVDYAVVNTGAKTFNTIFVQGRKVAIDASMSIYQFLIAVRQEGNMLTNADGETTR